MNLLFITRDYSQYTFSQTHYLLSELAKITNQVVWYEGANDVNDIVHQLNIEPDFIFVHEYCINKATTFTGLSTLSIPYAISLTDLHKSIKSRKEVIQRENVQYIFSLARDKFFEWYPEFIDRFLWLPYHANTNVFKDHKLAKGIDYLLMGAVNEQYYPLRSKIINTMRNRPGFVYHPHPGYRNFTENDQVLIGEKYAREINRAKIFFTCGSTLQYPVAKYFEVLACKTLLLAPSFQELNDLGFIPGVHFVSINEDDFEEKAEYYLHHEKERLKIAEQGYEMVRSKHSTAQRAAQLLAIIEDIISSS